MKTNSILGFCVMTISICLTCAAQSGEVGSGMAGLGNGVSVRIVTKADPPAKATALKLSNRYASGNGVLHRFVIDSANRTYFGYDLFAEPLVGSRQCRVSIMPLAAERGGDFQQPSHASGATAGAGAPVQVDASYRPVFLPTYPGPQTMGDGDTIALDLLASSDGQQKITDYIDVSCKVPDANSSSVVVRDASLDDLEMSIADPTLYVNGTLVSSQTRGVHLSGALVWFFFPGKGRFILSVVPRRSQGFVLAGTIQDNSLTFGFGTDRFQVKSAATIFSTGQPCNLYILREPSFDPKSGLASGSAMRLGQLIPNR
jgi:hypothetical protein